MTIKRLKKLIENYCNTYKYIIKDGKKEFIQDKEYDKPCKEGYKRDPKTGLCVKMSLKEIRNRSIAATKSANKNTTKRNRKISMKRREILVQEKKG